MKKEISDFVISSLVMHELTLGLDKKYSIDEVFITIMNYIKTYFNNLTIDALNIKSLRYFRKYMITIDF